MDGIQEITQVISSVGFPIVACGALFWMINNALQKLSEANNDLTDAIRDLTSWLKHGEEAKHE